ncbi:MAG: MFS transporter [Geminicoccus sp.]|nr:MFS transporter [Geminicoccus sp.]
MFVLNGAFLGIWASRIPSIRDVQGLDKGQFGILLLVMAIGALISFPIAGRLADRFGAARITRILAVLYGASLVGIALAPVSILALGAAMFFFGATHGGMDVTMNSWATEVEKRAGRPIMSSFHATWSFGTGLGALSGYFAGVAGLGSGLHFLLAAALFSMLCLPFATIQWTSERTVSHGGAPLFNLPRGMLILVGLVGFCTTIGEGGMVDWSATFLIEVTQVNEARAALGFTAFSVLMVVTRLLGDRVIAALGPVLVTRLSGGIAALGGLLAVVAGTYWMSLLGFALMGIGYATIIPMAFSRAAREDGVSAGQAIASVATLGYGGLLLGPPIIGGLAELTSIRLAFGLLIVLAVLMSLIAGAMRPSIPKD